MRFNFEKGQVVLSKSMDETVQLGFDFAKRLQPKNIVALYGGMGSGKTTFVKGICAGLESADHVSSPTFTLINEYKGKCPIYHFDFYRIDRFEEVLELGCDEYFYSDGICLIEWPEKIPELLPEDRIELHFTNRFAKGRENIRRIQVLKR